MTTRRAGRSSRSRAPKKPMLWFNNGVDLATLAGSSSITLPILTAGTYPDYLLTSGCTILRMILRLTFGASLVGEVVNALAAVYVGTRGSAATPPSLNADLANYYWFCGVQTPANPVTTPAAVVEADIRSKRKIRGEDTDLFWRFTNNETTAVQVGFEARFLLVPS